MSESYIKLCKEVINQGGFKSIYCESYDCPKCPFFRKNRTDGFDCTDSALLDVEIAEKYLDSNNKNRTFTEVINTIEIGESWSDGIYLIKRHLEGIEIKRLDCHTDIDDKGRSVMYFYNDKRYNPARKKYSFLYALGSLRPSYYIESDVSGLRLAIDETNVVRYAYPYMSKSYVLDEDTTILSLKEINGGWYIQEGEI